MPENSANILKQVWFPGLHASLAGAYSPRPFGDISLCWMISELITLTALQFDEPFLRERFQSNAPLDMPWGAVPDPIPPPPDRFAYAVGPKLKRTPGEYPPPDGMIRNEYYHHSVMERIAGSSDGYPAGKAVVEILPMLPYTEKEREFATQAGLTNLEQVKKYWDSGKPNGA